MTFSIQKSSILGAGNMSFHVVAGERPSTEIENMNSGSNVYRKLDKTLCTYFEESVPEPFSVQSSIAYLNSQILVLSQILSPSQMLPLSQILSHCHVPFLSQILPLRYKLLLSQMLPLSQKPPLSQKLPLSYKLLISQMLPLSQKPPLSQKRPIRSHHVLMSILTIGLIVENFLAAKKFIPINTIASTIGTIASDRMTSLKSATKSILSCFPIVLIRVDIGQVKQHDLLRCVAIYYDL